MPSDGEFFLRKCLSRPFFRHRKFAFVNMLHIQKVGILSKTAVFDYVNLFACRRTFSWKTETVENPVDNVENLGHSRVMFFIFLV